MGDGMRDLAWERQVPFVQLDIPAMERALRPYDAGLRVHAVRPVAVGCRNTNYHLDTNQGRLFLRLCAAGLQNEEAAHALLRGRVPMPALLYAGDYEGRRLLLYESVPGEPLQQQILAMGHCPDGMITQAARVAAHLHATAVPDQSGIRPLETPPFSEWYALFMGAPQTRARLGAQRLSRLERMLAAREDLIQEIAETPSVLIHADFRPANMLMTPDGRLVVVDWECLGFGHALGDIGQFFRYRRHFGSDQLCLFQTEYEKTAGIGLPQRWQELSLMRDLVNPLQMIGQAQDAPAMHADLLELIDSTLGVMDNL